MKKNLYMKKIGEKAIIASNGSSLLDIKKRNAVLKKFCNYLKIYSNRILKANGAIYLMCDWKKSGMYHS